MLKRIKNNVYTLIIPIIYGVNLHSFIIAHNHVVHRQTASRYIHKFKVVKSEQTVGVFRISLNKVWRTYKTGISIRYYMCVARYIYTGHLTQWALKKICVLFLCKRHSEGDHKNKNNNLRFSANVWNVLKIKNVDLCLCFPFYSTESHQTHKIFLYWELFTLCERKLENQKKRRKKHIFNKLSTKFYDACRIVSRIGLFTYVSKIFFVFIKIG